MGMKSNIPLLCGVLMLAAGGAALVHAVLPFMFETTASRILRGMCAEIDARAHNR